MLYMLRYPGVREASQESHEITSVLGIGIEFEGADIGVEVGGLETAIPVGSLVNLDTC